MIDLNRKDDGRGNFCDSQSGKEKWDDSQYNRLFMIYVESTTNDVFTSHETGTKINLNEENDADLQRKKLLAFYDKRPISRADIFNNRAACWIRTGQYLDAEHSRDFSKSVRTKFDEIYIAFQQPWNSELRNEFDKCYIDSNSHQWDETIDDSKRQFLKSLRTILSQLCFARNVLRENKLQNATVGDIKWPLDKLHILLMCCFKGSMSPKRFAGFSTYIKCNQSIASLDPSFSQEFTCGDIMIKWYSISIGSRDMSENRVQALQISGLSQKIAQAYNCADPVMDTKLLEEINQDTPSSNTFVIIKRSNEKEPKKSQDQQPCSENQQGQSKGQQGRFENQQGSLNNIPKIILRAQKTPK
jgi:hypothetical protein